MDEELKARFLRQKFEDLLNDNTKPIPTIICELENVDAMEAVRKNVLLAVSLGVLVTFTWENVRPAICEGIDKTKGQINYGELFLKVSLT